MSEEKEKLNQLVNKIDELLQILKDVSEDLKTVSSSVKSLAVAQITAKPTEASSKVFTSIARDVTSSTSPRPQTSAQVGGSAKTQNVEDLRILFPEDLDVMLVFEDKGDYIMIKPKQFLGSENFAKIASTVRGIGGDYISAGKDSHFRVYKKKP